MSLHDCIHAARQVLTALACLVALSPVSSGARTFYVAVSGDDGRDGLSAATAWKSPDRVNAAFARKAVQAGDTVAFRCGDTFAGFLDIAVSGKPGRPVVLDAYGNGAPPVLDAVSHHYGVSFRGSRIVVSHLQVSAARSAAFLFTGGVSRIDIRDCTACGTPFMSTSTAFRFSVGRIGNITVERVVMRGITEFGFYAGGGVRLSGLNVDTVNADSTGYGFYAEGAELSGIRIAQSSFSHENGSGIRLVDTRVSDLEIVRCTASENRVNGVSINGVLNRLKFTELISDGCGSHGLFLDPFSGDEITVERCRLTGARNEKNGLGLDGRGNTCRIIDTIASRNTGDGFNVHGSWKNVVLDRCTADENGFDGKGWDGDGYTFHEDSVGRMVKCIARNNKKSAVAHVHRSSVDMERCIFTHDTNGTVPLAYLQGARFALRNCVLYSGAQTGAGILCLEGDVVVRNTIVRGFDTGFENRKARVVQDHNLVYGAKTAAWKGLTPGPGSLEADPLFTNPVTLDFTLRTGSPCIDAGTDDGSGEDFSGTPVPRGKAPDIGGYEFDPGGK